MNRILEYFDLDTDELKKEKKYLELPYEQYRDIKNNDFLFFSKEQDESNTIEIICSVRWYDKGNLKNLKEIRQLNDNDKIIIVPNDNIIKLKKDTLKDLKNSNYIQLCKLIKSLFKEIKWLISYEKHTEITKNRKKYLLDSYHNKIGDFIKMDMREQLKWYEVINRFDINLLYNINLYILWRHIYNSISTNKKLKKKEQEDLLSKYKDYIECMYESLHKKSMHNFLANITIGISFTSDGENIILGEYSKSKFLINFYTFWNVINRTLMVSLLPIMLIFLDAHKKIYIYLLLGMAYFISSILSDENQVKNIVEYIKRIVDKEETFFGYPQLFIFGFYSITICLLYAFQLIVTPEKLIDSSSVIIHLGANFLLANFALAFILVLISFVNYIFSWVISRLFFIRIKDILLSVCSAILSCVVNIGGIYCLYSILDMRIHFYSNAFNWKIVVFCLSSLIAIANVFVSIQKIRKKKLKQSKV